MSTFNLTFEMGLYRMGGGGVGYSFQILIVKYM